MPRNADAHPPAPTAEPPPASLRAARGAARGRRTMRRREGLMRPPRLPREATLVAARVEGSEPAEAWQRNTPHRLCAMRSVRGFCFRPSLLLMICTSPRMRAVLAAVVLALCCRTAAMAICGDGTLDLGEECDDGNLLDGDCCSSGCLLEPEGTICRPAAGPCDVQE